MTTFDMATDALAKYYDEVPYESRPFAQSHPAHSSALARLFGLLPADVAKARVLELGCAAGGNLIPMAMEFPGANFTGIDLSPLQVAEGTARVASLGLSNIKLRHQSIVNLSAGHGQFDYIICHGVYSWVPPAVRDAILRVANENLAENGIAYISYNVHPGWRLRGVLREAMQFHIAGIDRPAEQVRAARAFLTQLAEISDAASAYGLMLRQEARALATHHDYYILHEFLEHTNDPCYVTDFLAKARTAGLTYLTEANLNATIAESFGAQAGPILRDLSGNRLDRMEQYIDFLTGRTFRQSLLVKSTQESSIVRLLEPKSIHGLEAQAKVTLAEERADGMFVLRDPAGRTLTTPLASVRDALLLLARDFPRSRNVADLADAVATDGHAEAGGTGKLQDAIFKMVLIGMAQVRTVPAAPLLAVADAPVALPLARADAAAGRPWTTNACHESISLTVVQQVLLPLLDGTNDRIALVAAIESAACHGRLAFQRAGETLTGGDAIAAAASEHVTSGLEGLMRSALLIDGPKIVAMAS